MKQILLFDRAMLIRMRIKEALSSAYIKIIEVENENELNNALIKYKNAIDLLIMDIASDAADGFDMVRRIKEAEPHLPVVILTASNKRADFIKGIQAGAADYILKPFEDEFFKQRILSVMENEHAVHKAATKKSGDDLLAEMTGIKPAPDVHIKPIDFSEVQQSPPKRTGFDQTDYLEHTGEENFNDLLKAEKYKARKGKYPLSVFALVFDQMNLDESQFTERHFDDIRAQLWESDEFIHYGPHSFFGILPFCHENGFERFKEKMQHYLNEEANEHDYYQKHKWHVIGITIPAEENEKLEIEEIVTQLKTKIDTELET